MRNLGKELEVEAMSLYKHVANKEDMSTAWWTRRERVVVPSTGRRLEGAMRRRAISATRRSTGTGGRRTMEGR